MREKMETNGMMDFDYCIHTYMLKNRKAEVYKVKDNFGIRMYENNVWMKDQIIKNHSEGYAENAAENYVFRVNS